MRWALFAGIAFLSLGTAWAQNGGSEIVIPPASPVVPQIPLSPPAIQQVPLQPPQGLAPAAPPLNMDSPPPPPVHPALQQPPPGLVPASPPPDIGDATTPTAPDSGVVPAAPDIPPVMTPMPQPDGGAATQAPPPAAPPQLPPPDVAPALPNDWSPGTTAILGVLNKVDGSTSQLQLSVNGPAETAGDLSVVVQACMNRPAGEMPDTAVFLTVTPTQQGAAPLYRGWMLRSAPGATFVGNAGQTFRVISCS